MMLLAYWHHARHSPAPVLDLNLLSIKTFNIGTMVGGLCRVGLDATPFLLPLLFQVGFGLSATEAGLLTFSSTLSAMAVRSFSRTLLRLSGFRRTLVGGAIASAAVTAGFALLGADTPYWVTVLVVLLSGCVRSIQYLALNTISYADVPSALLSRSTSVGGVVQQVARGFGVAIGAALLALVAGGEHVTTSDFRIVFLLTALIPLASAAGFLRLSHSDGAEVSGHRKPGAVKAKAAD
jgi:MFS family permease